MKGNVSQSYEMDVDDLVVEVSRKDILHLHVYVTPPFGLVSASVPLDVPDDIVISFVREHRPWIEGYIAEFDNRAWTTPRQFVSGESIWIFGRQRYLEVEESDEMAFDYVADAAMLRCPDGSSVAEREAFVYAALSAELDKKICALLPSIVKATGSDVNDVIVGKWGTRWSNCSRETGNISVSSLLVHHAPAALRLVLTYECLHLRYNPSSSVFERKLEELVPEWKLILDRMNSVPLPRE